MKNICLSLAFCLIFLSCHSIENVKIVSLFYRECDITYKFYNQNGELDRILDYEKTDSCNMLILQDPTPSFLYQEKTVPQDLCIDDFIHVYKLESDKHWEKTDKSYEWFLNQTYDRIVER